MAAVLCLQPSVPYGFGRLLSLSFRMCHLQIGLSIQHDASHGAISKRPWVNALFAYGIDCIGSSRWIWLQSHIMRHHPYTNHQGLDLDAGSAEPFILFHDYPAASQNRKVLDHLLTLACYFPVALCPKPLWW